MNVDCVADIDGDCHAGILERERLALRIADIRPKIFRGGVPVSDLNKKKWEIALTPCIAPIANHSLKKVSIERRAILAGIGLALVPDHATDGRRRKWRDHAIEESRWRPRRKIRMPLPPRYRLAICLGLRDGLLIVAFLLLQLQNGSGLSCERFCTCSENGHERCVG